MPLDNYVAAEILATCNALGNEINGVYHKSADCLECLKDLIKYLRRDDEEHSVRKQLGDIGVVKTDLLPILKRYHQNKELFEMTLRLLVVLLHPALLLFKEELPEDKLELHTYLTIVSHLQGYKLAFTDSDVWSVLSESLTNLLKMSYEDRDDDERLTVERILIIIRNVLHVPPDELEKRTDDDVSVHDQVLWALHVCGMVDLLLYLSHSKNEQHYCLHVLEIISLMLREQTPEILVSAGKRRTEFEKEQDERKLLSARRKELEERQAREKVLSSRRFNGSYYVKNFKSISDRDHISHKLLSKSDTIKFDSEAMQRRRPKNRLPISDVDMSRRSTLSICLFLRDFCSNFIDDAYNIMMSIVKRNLDRKRSEEHDDSYYLWAVSYFLEFNRRNSFQLAVVSETVSVQTFHYVQTQIDNYYDMLLSDKKKIKYWSKRMHLGLKAYKELLETVRMMDLSKDEVVKQYAEIIKSNVFYVIEYREMILSLIMNYDEIRFSRLYLEDLIQTIHLFLKMLETYGKKHSLIVQQKKRKKSKKKKAKRTKLAPIQNVESEIEKKWDDVTSDLSAMFQGRKPIPTDIIPFDATSEISFEEQKTEIVYKIQNALKAKAPGEAIAMLRAARELWPENNAFGSSDIEPEDEFLLLREIFFADLPQNNNISEMNGNEEEDDEEEEEEKNEETACISEQQLKFEDFIKRFASYKIIQPCYLLLKCYKKNSVVTNSCLLKLMHRIAWDCKMHGLFFQASIFLVFQAILHDSDRHHDPIAKELSRFAKFIVSKFFETAEKNKKVFVEMLFWKNSKDAYEIEEGYGSSQTHAIKSLWTENEEEELKELYNQHKDSDPEDGDVVDTIIGILDKPRTRREVITKIRQLGLIQNVRDLKPKKSKTHEWQEAEIMELQTLFEEHKESGDVLGQIMQFMTIKRSKKAIIDKLLELNIVEDRSELKKRRKPAKVVHIC